MQEENFTLDLSGATGKQIAAIKNKADREGVSFEEAAKRMLLSRAEKDEQKAGHGLLSRLFRRPSVYSK